MRVYHLRSELSHQTAERIGDPGVGDCQVERFVRIGIKPAECPAPTGHPVHLNVAVHLGAGPIRPRHRDDLDPRDHAEQVRGRAFERGGRVHRSEAGGNSR